MISAALSPDENERLQALYAYDVLDSPVEQNFDRITALAKRLFNVPIALISLSDRDQQWLKSYTGLSANQTTLDIAFGSDTILGEEVLFIPDATLDPRFADNPLVIGSQGIRFYAGGILRTPSGFRIGTLCLIDTVPRYDMGEKECANLQDLAAMVVSELELRRVLHRSRAETTTVEQITQAPWEREALRLFVEHTPAAVAMFDRDMRYMLTSHRWLSDYGLQEKDVLGCSHYKVFPNLPEHWKESYQRCLAGAVERCEEDRHVRSDGVVEWLSWEMRPWHTREGQIGGIVFLTEAISKRKRIEEALRQSEERFHSAFSSAALGMAIVSLDGQWLQVNTALCQILGYTQEELFAKQLQEITHPDDLESNLARVAKMLTKEIDSYSLEKRYIHKQGHAIWILLSVSMAYAFDGNPLYIIAQMLDIDARKKIEAALNDSLAEKEVLLREIHHRVKNNLQVICSLLSLQTKKVYDTNTLELLNESQNRIRSMAMVHEALYQSSNLAEVDFGDYLRNLATYLFASYSDSALGICLDLMVENITLNIDIAIPCGLIVNELISNALKHAFIAVKSGCIQIRFEGTEDGCCVLSVIDNGIGLPRGFDPALGQSMGLRILRVLTKQIGGSSSFESANGTQFILRFPRFNKTQIRQ
jgi:PAS domain S-box-containing protein